MSIFIKMIVSAMALMGLLLSLATAVNAQTAEELKRYMEINNNAGKAADDIMRSVNGPAQDPNIGV